jgi:hypothetical protein
MTDREIPAAPDPTRPTQDQLPDFKINFHRGGGSRLIVTAGGLIGRLILAFAVPLISVITGISVLALGAIAYVLRRRVVRST